MTSTAYDDQFAPDEHQSCSVTAEEVMEQVQVYASTWSLVGGPFDSGDTLDRAHSEKAKLKILVERLAFERDAYREGLQELADRNWPEDGIKIGFKERQYPEHLRQQAGRGAA